MPTYSSRTVSVVIDRPWRDVYKFAAEPANMVKWAAGLGRDFKQEGDVWVADQDGTRIRIRFSASNDHGVLDHDVHVGADTVVHVAMRVVPNGTGAEVTFLVLQERGMTDAKFERDVAAVRKDLETLKGLLETAEHSQR